MNEAQETCVKEAARKIEAHAETIRQSMQALQRHNLLDMPVNLIEVNFCDVTNSCGAMQHMLEDLLANLP